MKYLDILDLWKTFLSSYMMCNNRSAAKKAYAALSMVIIISAVVLVITTTVALLSINDLQASFAATQGESSINLLDECGEDVLLRIRSNPFYYASGSTLTEPEGSCIVTTTRVGPNWTIRITTSSTQYARGIQIVAVRNPTGITVTSWSEISL